MIRRWRWWWWWRDDDDEEDDNDEDDDDDDDVGDDDNDKGGDGNTVFTLTMKLNNCIKGWIRDFSHFEFIYLILIIGTIVFFMFYGMRILY